MALIIGCILGWLAGRFYQRYMVIEWPRAIGNAKGPPMIIHRGDKIIDPSGGDVRSLIKKGRRAKMNVFLVRFSVFMIIILIIANV